MTGFPISCAALPSALPTSASCCEIYSVHSFLAVLLLATNRHAVTQRNQNGIELFRGIDQPVEFLHTECRSIIRSGRSRRLARPERIVRDEQSSSLEFRQRHAQSVRVLVLVHIVEDQVKFARSLLQQFECVAHLDIYALGHSSPPKVLACALRIRRISVGIMHFPLWSCRSREPNCRVADS